MKRLLPLYFIMFADVLGWGVILTILAPLLLGTNDYFSAATPTYVRAIVYGFLGAIFPLGQFFGAPLFGELSDNYGRRKTLGFSLIGSCIGFILSAVSIWIHSIVLLFVSRLVQGCFSGNQTVALAAISDLSPPEKRGKYLSYTGLYSGVSFILGPFVGGQLSEPQLVSWFNFSTPFLFTALIFFLVFLIFIIGFKESFVPKKKVKLRLTEGFSNIASIFKYADLKIVFVTYLIWLIGWMFFMIFFSAILFDVYGFRQGTIGNFQGFEAVMFAIGSYVLGKILEKGKLQAHQLIPIPCAIIGVCSF